MEEQKDKQDKHGTEALETLLAEYKGLFEKFGALLEPTQSVFSKMFENMSTYVNHVVTIGYAGFFGIWAFSREYMSPASNLLTAVFMLFSIVLFIGSQIVDVILLNRASASILKSGADESLRSQLERVQTALNVLASKLRKYFVVRPWVLNASILFAVAAVLIMVVGLFGGLYDEYKSPL